MLKIAKAESGPSHEELELTRLISIADGLKKKQLQVTVEYEEAQSQLVDAMRLYGKKTVKTVPNPSFHLKATLVQGETVKYNEPGLKKALGAPLWRKVTKTVLDKKALEDAVKDGIVDINTVAEHTVVNPNKAYVRISPVDESDDA